MKKITLPELYKVEKLGKNEITQFIADETSFKPDSMELGDTYIVAMDGDRPICIAQKGKASPHTNTRVLVADKKPTTENIYAQPLTWLKHPQLNRDFDPAEARESWINAFQFKEEDLAEYILRLR